MAKNISLLAARNLKFSTPNTTTALIDLKEIAIEPGSFLYILGVNGAGKSTLLSILGGQQAPVSGDLFWKGQYVKPVNERLVPGFPGIALVKQDTELDPFLKVEETIEKALRSVPDVEARKQHRQIVSTCQLKSLLSKKVGDLSGGEKRRLAIAVAISGNPELLLLDEPYADLDYENRDRIQAILLYLRKKKQVAIVMVSHLGTDALWLADKIITLFKGKQVEHLIRMDGAFLPQSVKTARLLGWKNLISTTAIPELIKSTVRKEFAFAHIPPAGLCLTATPGFTQLGNAEVLRYYKTGSLFSILFQMGDFFLETTSDQVPVGRWVLLYFDPRQLVWLRR